jgi:putative transposase
MWGWGACAARPPITAKKCHKIYRKVHLMNHKDIDPPFPQRRSIRLAAYDYSSNGAYFVTISLQERRPLLNNPDLRTILAEIWKALPQRFPGVVLDEYMIMPDHVHFILWLNPQGGNCPKLSNVIDAYKSLTGRAGLSYLRLHEGECGKQFWQRGYYEHVIRSEFELLQKRTYIRDNPIKEQLKQEDRRHHY